MAQAKAQAIVDTKSRQAKPKTSGSNVVSMNSELWPSAKIMADQDQIKTIGKTFDDRVHANAVQCILHAQKHGDVTLFERLLKSVPAGYQVGGLKTWALRNNFPIQIERGSITKDDPLGKLKLNTEKAKEPDAWKGVAEASKTPFFDMPENARHRNYSPLDVTSIEKMLNGMLTMVDNASKNEGRYHGIKGNPEDLKLGLNQAVKAFRSTMQNPKAVRDAIKEQVAANKKVVNS